MPRFNSASDAAIWGEGGQDGFFDSAPPRPAVSAARRTPPAADAHGAVLAALNQIQMLAETLAETNLDPMQQELVQFLLDAGMVLRREVLGADQAPEPEELEIDDLGEPLAPRLAAQDYLDFDIGDDIVFENRQRLNLVCDNSDLLARPPLSDPALDDDLIVEDIAAESDAATPSAAGLDVGVGPLDQLRILVADDNPAQQSAARVLLEGLGAVCGLATIGAAAELARAGGWDAILIDVHAPGRAGLSSMRAIRADELGMGQYRTAILALLSHASPEQIRDCLTAGADGYLSKPLHRAAALEQLEGLSFERGLERRTMRA